MCQSLKHGGPDDEGIFSAENVGLCFGHRRLSIIDLSVNGHQPMADVDERAWITFNGEIYNYPELKQRLLAAGVKFHSNTDTEVIINAYLNWGVKAFSELRGMFAFALYDKLRATTYLVRDSSGIKPLYYYAENGILSFASEIRAFKASGVVNENDPDWPVRFLAFGHVPEPYTILKNVRSLAKGHYLIWEHNTGKFSTARFHKAAGKTEIVDALTAQEAVRDALQNAVKRQLIADAPIGVFLSGGVDSSLISLLAVAEKWQQFKTVSIYFDEKTYDERSYQNTVLKKISVEKHGHLVKQEDFERSFGRIIDDMDMPTTDGINSWFISKYARQDGLKAVLSGLGADELFGGYPSFNRIKYIGYLRKSPSPLFFAANYFKTDRYRKVSFLTRNHYLADYLLLRGLFVPADIAQILDTDVKYVDNVLFPDKNRTDLGPYNETHAAWFEQNLYMQNQLLRDTDVMSMSHGLEVRVPFLDEDFQQMISSIAPEILFNKSHPKKLLIDSFEGILPQSIWNRRKMGFTFPLQEWMAHHPEISDETLYRGKLARNSVIRFKKGQIHWSKAFALYQVQQHV